MAGELPEVLANSRYYLGIELEGSQQIDAYFSECQGFKRSQEVIEVCEVAPQKWAKAKHGRVVRTKIPGNTKHDNIILRRGLTVSDTLWKWFKAVEEGDWANERRYGDLTLYDQGINIQARFRFEQGWPVSYKLGDLKSDGADFQIEELELAVEEFRRVKPNGEEY